MSFEVCTAATAIGVAILPTAGCDSLVLRAGAGAGADVVVLFLLLADTTHTTITVIAAIQTTAAPTAAAMMPPSTAAPETRVQAPIDAGLHTEVLAGGADLVISALKDEQIANHLRSGGHQPDWRSEAPRDHEKKKY